MLPLFGCLSSCFTDLSTYHALCLRTCGSVVNCTHKHLDVVPCDLPNDTIHLDLSFNHINVLKNDSFQHLTLLRWLSITHSHVNRLESGTFAGLSRLKTLYLANNAILLDNSSYSAVIFYSLENLRDLDIGHNDNRNDGIIPDHIFKPLTNLESLRIDTFRNTKFGVGFSYLKKLKALTLNTDHCSLEKLENDTFEMFRNSHLEFLSTSGCGGMHFIDSGAFLPLPYISELELNNLNQVTTSTAIKAFYGLNGKNISKLSMRYSYHPKSAQSNLKEQFITNETVSHLNNICIEYLDLTHNTILYIDFALLNALAKCTKHFDISYNSIYGRLLDFIDMVTFKHLLYMDASYQLIFRTKSSASYHEQLDEIGNRNMIDHSHLKDLILPLPQNITVLKLRDISGNMGRLKSNISFIGGSHLTTIDFSYNGVSGLVNTIHGLQHVKDLDLSGNIGEGINAAFLKTCPNVKSLKLNNMGLDQRGLLDEGSFYEGLMSLEYIEQLELAGNNIQHMSKYMPWTLEILNVSQNTLVDISIDVDLLPRLRILDLSFNSITHLEQSDMDTLDELGAKNNLTLKLDGNPISCSCHELLFVLWLFSSPVSLDKAGRYRCVTDNDTVSTTDMVYDNFNYHWTYCQGRYWFPISTSLMLLLFLGIVTTLMVTRNLTRIQHYLLELIGRGVRRDCRRDFPYELFVGHCDADIRYIAGVVGPCLERFQIDLFLPDRDIKWGHFIADGIAKGVEDSWRILLVITEDFLQDPWSYYIMRTVAYSVSNSNPNMVMMLLIGDVNRAEIPELLLNVTEEDNIFNVDALPDDGSDIWIELRDRIMMEA